MSEGIDDNANALAKVDSPDVSVAPPPPLPEEAVPSVTGDELGDDAAQAAEEAAAEAIFTEKLKYQVKNAEVRGLRIIQLPELETYGATLFAREWSVRAGFRLVAAVRQIVDKLVKKGVISRKADENVQPWNQRLDGLLAVVDEAEEDVLNMVQQTIFTDMTCQKDHKLQADVFEEIGVGDLVTILRAIWAVNVTEGSSKNLLGGLFKKTP